MKGMLTVFAVLNRCAESRGILNIHTHTSGLGIYFSKIFLAVFFCLFVITDSFGICSTGYTELTDVGSSFRAPQNGGCRLSSQELITLPDELEMFYSALISGDEVTLCTNGYASDGTCVQYSAGNCPSGDVELVSDVSFRAPQNGSCKLSTQEITNISDEYSILYSALLVGNEVTLCTNGYASDGSCVSYLTGDCPTGYYDMATSSTTFISPNNYVCSSGYVAYGNTTHCDHNPGVTCVTLPTATMNINWYNYQDTITHNDVCYEGDLFPVPSPSSRPGYTFSGWRTKQ